MDIGYLRVALALARQHRRHGQGSALCGCSQARAQPFMRHARRESRRTLPAALELSKQKVSKEMDGLPWGRTAPRDKCSAPREGGVGTHLQGRRIESRRQFMD